MLLLLSFSFTREDVRPDNGIHTGFSFQIALVVTDFLFNTHRYAFSIDLYEDLLVLVRLLANGSELSPNCKVNEYHVYASRFIQALKINRQVLKNKTTPEKLETFNYQQMTSQDDLVATVGKFVSNELKRDIAFYETLGAAFYSTGRFMTSIWYYEKAAEMSKVAEGRLEQQRICTCLAVVHNAANQFDKALNLQERALQLSQEIGDVKGEVECYNHLGSFYTGRGQYDLATKFYGKGLELVALNDTMSEAMFYNNLGNMHHASGQYLKSIDYHMKSLRIREAANDTKGRGITYNNLSCVCYSLGQYENSVMYQEKALEISQTIGAKKQVAVSYFNLGCVYQALGKHKLSLENHEKGLKVRKEIGNNEGESRSYREISSVHDALGHFAECMKYHEKALKAEQAIQNRGKDGPNSDRSVAFGQRVKWIAHHKKGLECIDEIGPRDNERLLLFKISLSHTSRLNILKASNYLSENIRNHEEIRLPLEEEYKLSLDEQSVPLYKTLSLMLISFLHYTDALLALEQGRARALVDLVLSRYAIQEVNTTNFENLSGITSFFATQQNNFLFMATIMNNICLWFVDRAGNLRFKSYFVTKDIQKDSLLAYFRFAPRYIKTKIQDSESRAMAHAGYLCEAVAYSPEEQFGVPFLHHVIFGVADDLPDDEEIIFVPEGSLFHVPFAALENADGNYLSERVRLRLVPSITTLKIIQDSPADYHSKKGALLVGDPKVGRFNINGRVIRFEQLPCARREVKMIAELLGVSCLVGESATKEAVLRRISNVSLVHIAAHADAERGEIVLAAE